MQSSYSYPCYDYSKINKAAFGKQGLSSLKQEHLLTTAKTADKLASLAARPHDASHIYTLSAQQSVENVAEQAFGMTMVRYTAHSLFPKENLSMYAKAKEMILSYLKKTRHLSEHDELKTKITQAVESNNPEILAALTQNDGFLTMCLHDKDLLYAFRGILKSHIIASPLTQKISPNIKQIQDFINLQPAELSIKLQHANANFYTDAIEAKTNEQTTSDLASTVIKSAIATIPFVGSVAAASISVADSIQHMNLSEVSAAHNDSNYHANQSKLDKVKHHLIEECNTGNTADNPSRYSKVKIMPSIAAAQVSASPAVITAIATGSVAPLIDPITGIGGALLIGGLGVGSAVVKNIGSKKLYLKDATHNISEVGLQSILGDYSDAQ